MSLVQDFESFLGSLPNREWPHYPLYQYQNFWNRPKFIKGLIATQQKFQAQDSDIILATFPKCGTTWLKALVYTLVHRNQHHPGNFTHPLLNKNPHDLVPHLEIQLYIDNKTPDFSHFPAPRIVSTHAPFESLPDSIHSSKCKLVYLSRNPKDTLVSFWFFRNRVFKNNTIPMEEFVDRFCEGSTIYGPFWDHVLDYWKKSLECSEKVLFLKFEELIDRPAAQLRRLAEFLGCPFSGEEEGSAVVEAILEMCEFGNLSSLEVNRSGKISTGDDSSLFFRRGEVGDWKNHLTAEMAERLDALTELKFQDSGLKL